jgi:magnesium transporter
MLSSALFRAFTTPVTYALLFILLSTAVMQVRYVNKALQRFDSTQVIPIQFVTFTLCVIIGSAVLYRDFERTSAEQAAKFVGGCLLTFFGVFLITSGRTRGDEEEDGLSDAEGVEETIGLAAQDHGHPGPQSIDSTPSSRRSSRASRLSYLVGDPKLYGMSHDSGIPTARAGSGPPLRSPGVAEYRDLLGNEWDDSDRDGTPSGGPRMISDSALPTLTTMSATPSEPSTPFRELQGPFPYNSLPEEPFYPRPALSTPVLAQRSQTHQYSGPIFSPSPLSSTVNAVVKDTLLRNAQNPLMKRPSVKRLRTSIRASLFMSEDEIQAQRDIEAEAHRKRLASRSQDHITQFPDPSEAEALAASQDPPGSAGRRPRSMSDTLGHLFRVKRKKGRPAEEQDDAEGC